MCQTRGGLKKALICKEPSELSIRGPQMPIVSSDLIVRISVSIVPGGTSVSRLRRKTNGELVRAKPWLFAAPKPRFSELLTMRSCWFAINGASGSLACNWSRLSSAEALSTITMS